MRCIRGDILSEDIIVPMLDSLSPEEKVSVIKWQAMIKQLLAPKYVDLFLREQKSNLGPMEKKMLKETLNQFREYLVEESYSVLCQRILIMHDNVKQKKLEKEIVHEFQTH